MKKLLALVSLLILVAPFSAAAANFKSGETITVQEKQTDDVYATGENITTKADIQGDLVGFAGIVALEAPVSEDVFVAGGTITIDNVGDDVWVAGGTITINGEVGDDVFVAGGTITFGPDAHVKGSLNVAGGMVVVNGTVDGAVTINGGDVQVNGTLAGSAKIQADRITVNGVLGGETTLAARQIMVAEGAEIAGRVRYWQQAGPITADSAIKEGGSFTYDDTLAIKQATRNYGIPIGALTTMALISLLAAALVLALFVHFDKGGKELAARTLSKQYWKSLLAGLVFYIMTPIVGVLLCISIIGAPIGLFVLAMYGFAVYAGSIITALVLTKWIDLRRTKQFGKWTTFFVALGLLVVIRIVMWIPFADMLLILFIVPASVGSVILSRYATRKAQGKSAAK